MLGVLLPFARESRPDAPIFEPFVILLGDQSPDVRLRPGQGEARRPRSAEPSQGPPPKSGPNHDRRPAEPRRFGSRPGSRRPDSNRGPLRYEGSLIAFCRVLGTRPPARMGLPRPSWPDSLELMRPRCGPGRSGDEAFGIATNRPR
jgi:hypothetical protein